MDKGDIAFAKGNYSEAILEFEEARKIADAKGVFPTPVIYQKLGHAESKIPGRELRAICWYGAYLSANPRASDADEVRKEMVSLKSASRENVHNTIQLAEEVGRQAASEERSRGDVEYSLTDVVVLWEKSGDFSRARAVAASIIDHYSACEAYEYIIYDQIEARDFAGASQCIVEQEHAADRIDVSYWQQSARLHLVTMEAHMAEEQIKAGDSIGARQSILRARKTADLLETDYFPSEAYKSIAEAQAAAGDIASAKKSVDLINGEDVYSEYKFDAQLAIAQEQIKKRDGLGARETLKASGRTANLIPQPDTQREKQIELAKIQAQAGDLVGAQDTLAAAVAKLRRNDSKDANAYYSLGLAQSDCGDIDVAKKTVAYVHDADARSSMLVALAQTSKKSTTPALEPAINPVYPWLWELDPQMMGRWGPHLNQPLFTDYSRFIASFLKKDEKADQKFSELQMLSREMIEYQKEIDNRLRDQFKL